MCGNGSTVAVAVQHDKAIKHKQMHLTAIIGIGAKSIYYHIYEGFPIGN
jgi:hypothetical protein